MVFVFMKTSYSNQTNNGWSHCKISCGLLVAVVLYVLVGAAAFLYLNPESGSQGTTQEFTTTFLDATYFMTVTITTVGFGDIVPTNDRTKLFLSAYIVLSLVLVGVMLEVTDFLFQIDIGEIEEEDEVDDERFLTTPRKKLFLSVGLVLCVMLASTLFYVLHEDFTVVDAIYFSVTTLTTVGYGDLTPNTDQGRVFAIFWIGLGTLTLFRAIGSLMDVMLESRKRAWRRQREERTSVIQRHLSARVGSLRLVNVPDTEIIEKYSKQELINVLTKLEFVLYRLQSKGAASVEELRALDDEFKAMTPEDIQDEFSKTETAIVFNSMSS